VTLGLSSLSAELSFLRLASASYKPPFITQHTQHTYTHTHTQRERERGVKLCTEPPFRAQYRWPRSSHQCCLRPVETSSPPSPPTAILRPRQCRSAAKKDPQRKHALSNFATSIIAQRKTRDSTGHLQPAQAKSPLSASSSDLGISPIAPSSNGTDIDDSTMEDGDAGLQKIVNTDSNNSNNTETEPALKV
jgi:hypothetical protein